MLTMIIIWQWKSWNDGEEDENDESYVNPESDLETSGDVENAGAGSSLEAWQTCSGNFASS